MSGQSETLETWKGSLLDVVALINKVRQGEFAGEQRGSPTVTARITGRQLVAFLKELWAPHLEGDHFPWSQHEQSMLSIQRVIETADADQVYELDGYDES